MDKTFQEENNELLEFILSNCFYQHWMNPNPKDAQFGMRMLELNLTASCNQKCKYCYLTMHGDQLYPRELRNKDKIISNLKLLVDYYLEKGYHPGRIDFFSGEIWGTALGNEAFDVIYDAIANRKWGVNYIMIPSNMSFLLDREKRKTIEDYIAAFKKIGVRLTFSGSIDGKYLEEENRPFNNDSNNVFKNSDDWYNFLFNWCKKYSFAFHPMVAANGIEKWKDNYLWWNKMFEKFGLDPVDYGMYLEVRNDDWSLDKIYGYVDFLNYMMDYDFENIYNKRIDKFFEATVPKNHSAGYCPYMLLDNGIGWGCGIDKTIIVRVGDLAIGPCHRTCYEQFIYGHYDIQDNKIIGVKASNVQLANFVFMGSTHSMGKCNNCPIMRYCLRGCLGAQFEYTGEILQPIDSVCNELKAKTIFLYLKYKQLEFFDLAKSKRYQYQEQLLSGFEKKCMLLKKGEPKLWNYWEQKIQKILQASMN